MKESILTRKKLFLRVAFVVGLCVFQPSTISATTIENSSELFSKIQELTFSNDKAVLLKNNSVYQILEAIGFGKSPIDLAIDNCARHVLKSHIVKFDQVMVTNKSLFASFENFDFTKVLRQILQNKGSIVTLEETIQKEKVIVLYVKLPIQEEQCILNRIMTNPTNQPFIAIYKDGVSNDGIITDTVRIPIKIENKKLIFLSVYPHTHYANFKYQILNDDLDTKNQNSLLSILKRIADQKILDVLNSSIKATSDLLINNIQQNIFLQMYVLQDELDSALKTVFNNINNSLEKLLEPPLTQVNMLNSANAPLLEKMEALKKLQCQKQPENVSKLEKSINDFSLKMDIHKNIPQQINTIKYQKEQLVKLYNTIFADQQNEKLLVITNNIETKLDSFNEEIEKELFFQKYKSSLQLNNIKKAIQNFVNNELKNKLNDEIKHIETLSFNNLYILSDAITQKQNIINLWNEIKQTILNQQICEQNIFEEIEQTIKIFENTLSQMKKNIETCEKIISKSNEILQDIKKLNNTANILNEYYDYFLKNGATELAVQQMSNGEKLSMQLNKDLQALTGKINTFFQKEDLIKTESFYKEAKLEGCYEPVSNTYAILVAAIHKNNEKYAQCQNTMKQLKNLK